MAAWLLPLASFAVISIGYSVPQLLRVRVPYDTMKNAAYIAVAAIVMGFVQLVVVAAMLSAKRFFYSGPVSGGKG